MALQAGSAVIDITPRTPCHLSGYAKRDHPHEDIHDPLSLRALYVRGSQDALLISADIIWFHDHIVERIEDALKKELDLAPENVLFFGTHTHSAPQVSGDNANQEWINVLENKAIAAALARTRLQKVRMTAGRSASKIGMNRREQTPDGRIVLGLNSDGPNDREMIVVALDGSGPVARICNFACHGTVMSQRNYWISGDWAGPAATNIEADPGGAFLLANGGAANIAPRIDRQDDFGPVEELAAEFVSDFQKTCKNLSSQPEEDTVGGAERTLHLPRKLRDIEEGMGKKRPVQIRGLRIGPLHILGFPGEVFSQTTIAVKEASPHDLTMVASYTSGGSGGYVPVAEAYDTGGYEVRVSPYAEEAEAILRAGFLELIQNLP